MNMFKDYRKVFFLNGTPKLITITVLKFEKWGLNGEMRFDDAVGMEKVYTLNRLLLREQSDLALQCLLKT